MCFPNNARKYPTKIANSSQKKRKNQQVELSFSENLEFQLAIHLNVASMDAILTRKLLAIKKHLSLPKKKERKLSVQI